MWKPQNRNKDTKDSKDSIESANSANTECYADKLITEKENSAMNICSLDTIEDNLEFTSLDYVASIPKGGTRTYTINTPNKNICSLEQKIVDILVESVFKQYLKTLNSQ